jgi:phosphoribosylaminoimidazolecarboxamide formyltransferase/IMP cyclohydrolase
VHGGLLAARGNPKHEEEMQKHGVKPIDLVVVNLYPFEQTVASGAEWAVCVENIDIGGPTMIRAAAKNHRYVAVVTSPMQYNVLVQELSENNGCTSHQTRKKLAARAFADTAAYDSMIAAFFSEQLSTEAPVVTRVYEHQVRNPAPKHMHRASVNVILF